MSDWTPRPSRRGTNYNDTGEEEVKPVTSPKGPALKWLEYGQVLYADVPWGPGPDDSKIRPVMYIGSEGKNDAIVRAMYSQPRLDADLVEYRQRDSFLDHEILLNRSRIRYVSNVKVEPKPNPLKVEHYE